MQEKQLKPLLAQLASTDSVVVSDGYNSYAKCARELGLQHEIIVVSENRPVLDEINTIVRPSIQLKDKNRGIFVQVNDHYTADSTNSSSSMQLSEVFSEKFESSIERSEAIIDHVMSLANRQES